MSGHSHAALPSADPRIFGPPTWECLHILAQNYPEQADRQLRKRWRRFLFALSHLLPCSHCGAHFRRFLRTHSLRDALTGRDSLVAFLVEAHNAVTRRTRPAQPPYAVACASRQYSYMSPKNLPLAGIWVPATTIVISSRPFTSALEEAKPGRIGEEARRALGKGRGNGADCASTHGQLRASTPCAAYAIDVTKGAVEVRHPASGRA